MQQTNEPVGDYSMEAWNELTPEEKEQARSIAEAVDAFLIDRRTLRYIECDANKDALIAFLEDHSLAVTHANLLFAYDSLCAEGALKLIPIQMLVPPVPTQPQPDPEPSAERSGPRSRGAFAAFRNGQPLHIHGPRNLQ